MRVRIFLVWGYSGDGRQITGKHFVGVYGSRPEADEAASGYSGPTDVNALILDAETFT